jgi:arylsulfatase
LLASLAPLQHAAQAAQREGLTPDSAGASKLRRSLDGANVAIIVTDAARADRFGCYGYPRDTTPNIDRLAADSVLFTGHHCQVTLTRASTASLFTGQFPDTHGIIYNVTESIEPDFTLASVFSRAGHRTALLSGNPTASPYVHVGTHFDDAFYRPGLVIEESDLSPPELLKHLEDWLSVYGESRFLFYLHFLPPHAPYESPAEFTDRFKGHTPPGYSPEDYSPLEFDFPIGDQRVVYEYPPLPGWLNLYDANLRYADWAVGEVLSLLRGAGVLDRTLVIVTSDHGEAFGEHGFIWHQDAIHDEVSHIPLIVRFPGRQLAGKRVGCLTQTIDLLPTLCDLFESPFPAADIQGRSLLPVLAGAADSAADYTVTKSFNPPKYMVRDDHYALLLYKDWKWRAFYDLQTDPGQRHNIIHQSGRRNEVGQLLRVFHEFADGQRHSPEEFLRGSPGPGSRPLPDDMPAHVRKALEALGYLK